MATLSGDQAKHSPLAMRQIVYPIHRQGARHNVLPLGRRLIEAGLIREDQLQTALAHQASEERRLRAIATRDGTDSIGRVKRTRFKRLGEVVAELGLVDEAKLLPIMGEQLGVEGVKLSQGLIDPDAVSLIPRSLAERLSALPILRVRDCLTVAMADPQDLAAIDALAEASRCKIRPVLTLAEGIDRLLPRCYEDDFGESAELATYASNINGKALDLDDVQVASAGSGTNGLLHYTLSQAIRQNASAIHLEPGKPVSSIRFRIDGILREAIRPKWESHDGLIGRLERLADVESSPKNDEPRDGLFVVRIGRREVTMQISFLSTRQGRRAVVRLLDHESLIRSLDQLGMPSATLAVTRRMLGLHGGLILLTGPKDCGISTTLYSITEHLRSQDRSITTIQHWPHLLLDQVCQLAWQDESNKVVEHALAQDSDVLIIEDPRSPDVVSEAIRVSASGRLVVLAMNAENGSEAISQLLNWHVDRDQLLAVLNGVISQRLLRRNCPTCSEIHHPEIEVLQSLGLGTSSLSFARGIGCGECNEQGYRGRLAVFEVLPMDEHLFASITSSKHDQHEATRPEYPSILSEAMGLAEQQLTSLDEVFRCVPRSRRIMSLSRSES
ncbi:MAG: ATPase, T2SS/T4P/T4SS family [Planctomycetota bacterium]